MSPQEPQDEAPIDAADPVESGPSHADALDESTPASIAKTGEIQSGKLAGRTLQSAILVLALPVLLEQLANACVGLVDKMLAGRLDETIVRPALDGVGLASYVGWFTGVAMSAIGIGGMALIARAMGSGDRVLANRSLGQALTFGVSWGVVVAIFMWFACPYLATLANLSDQASEFCIQYIRIIAIGMPVTSFMLVSMNCLHGAGETTRPFLIILVVNLVNMVSSWAYSGVDLRFGSYELINPFGFDANVIGIAVGTVTARTVGAILIYALMRRGVSDLKLHLSDFVPHLHTLKRIVRVGLPGFLDGMGLWAGQLVAVVWLIGMIAEQTGTSEGLMGAHEIAVQWEAFSFMPGFAFGVAAGALAGQFLGAGNPEMAARAVSWCLRIALMIMGFMGVVFIVFGEPLTRIISSDEQILRLTPQLLAICGVVQLPFAMSMVIRGALRGAGDTRASMFITWFSTYLIRIPLAWLFGYFLEFGLVGVWIGLSAELLFRGLLFLARFRTGKWKEVMV